MVMFSFLLALVCLSTFLTAHLINYSRLTPIRASALVTVIIAGLMSLTLPQDLSSAYAGAVLGGSFVGMSEPSRLTQKGLLIAGILFSLCYYYLLPLNKGFGGILGFFAFISCLVTYRLSTFKSN
jgi:hypothetical protein